MHRTVATSFDSRSYRAATPPSTRVRAADSILAHTVKGIETENIEARVADLEQAAELKKDQRD